MKSIDRALLLRLFRENFRQQWKLYALAILSMVLVAATTAASAWVMRDIVNGMVVTRDLAQVYQIAAFVMVIYLVKGFSNYSQAFFLSKAGNRIIADLQQRLYAHFLLQDAAFFQSHNSSDILTRITYNAQAARSVIDMLVTSFVRDLLTLAGLVGVMMVQQPWLALLSLALGPIAILGVRILLTRARKYMTQELASVAQLMHVVQETSTGIRVVKTFALEAFMKVRMGKAVRDIERQANRMARVEAATAPIMETLAGFAIAGMLAFSGVLVLQYGQTPGELMSFITALLLAYEPAKRLARMRVSIEGGFVAVRSLFEMLDHPVSLAESGDAVPLVLKDGAISLKNVTFAYSPSVKVLNDLSIAFRPGKTSAIVGPSGSGKSTLINLVMRMYDPDSGSVSLDGQDLRQLTFESLRASMAYVGQDTFLFTGTVRHNIALGRDGAGDDEIIAAAKAANAHDFILRLPQGYDTQVGDGGGSLSGGQRQRVTIARAILRNAPILILDEPTSALDSESEMAIAEALEKLSAGRTTLIIAHRLSTIAKAHEIFVLEAGKLVEQGSPEDLFERKGRFQQLFASQSLQFAE